MIVSRFFNGLAGSAFLSVAGGTVGDLFDRHELSAPMMLYTASPFVGPELGPLYALDALLRNAQALILPGLAGSLTSIQLGMYVVIGGRHVLTVSDRRWTFYVLLIWTGTLLAMIVLFVPETYHPV